MRVRFSPRALADLEAIRAFLVPRSPRGADNVRVEIARTVDHLAQFPGAGSITDEPDLFRYPMRKYSYTIFFRVMRNGELLEIARVIHDARVTNLSQLPD